MKDNQSKPGDATSAKDLAERAGRATAKALREGRQRGWVPHSKPVDPDGQATFAYSDFWSEPAFPWLKVTGGSFIASLIASNLFDWTSISGWLFLVGAVSFSVTYFMARNNYLNRGSSSSATGSPEKTEGGPIWNTQTNPHPTPVSEPPSSVQAPLVHRSAVLPPPIGGTLTATAALPVVTPLPSTSTLVSAPPTHTPPAPKSADDKTTPPLQQKPARSPLHLNIQHHNFEKTSQLDKWMCGEDSKFYHEDGAITDLKSLSLNQILALGSLTYLNWLGPLGFVATDKIAKSVITAQSSTWQPQLAAVFHMVLGVMKRTEVRAIVENRVRTYHEFIRWTHANPISPERTSAPHALDNAHMLPKSDLVLNIHSVGNDEANITIGNPTRNLAGGLPAYDTPEARPIYHLAGP